VVEGWVRWRRGGIHFPVCDLPFSCEGESRGFAFVKFFAVEAAKEYMDKYFPIVYLGKQKIKIAYSLGRGEEENGWTCDKVLMAFKVLWSWKLTWD
jgi:hypothetical protein